MFALLRKSLLRPIVLAAILGTGLLAVWGIVGSIGISIVESSGSRGHENLMITNDGEPLVAQWRPDVGFYTYRGLDGKAVETSDENQRAPMVELPAGSTPRVDPGWSRFMVSFAEGSNPPNFWYLVHDGQTAGHAYFVGFNSESKQRIGYIGQKGFRAEPPALDEQFTMDRSLFITGTNYSSGGNYYAGVGRQPYVYGYSPAVPPPVYVLAEGKLWKIELDRRSASVLPLADPVLSVASSVNTPKANGERRIAVRTPKEILFLDIQGQQRESLRIPEQFRGETVQLTHWWGEDPIYVSDYWAARGDPELYWFDSDGKLQRQVTVQLAQSARASSRSVIWGFAVICPAPILLLVIMFFLIPLEVASGRGAPDVATALGQSVAAGWPWFLIVCLLSVALAVVCYRRHRKYSETRAAAWAAFVLIAGPAGYFGYVLHRHWGAKETCQQCHEVSPRDRDACLHCGTAFPPPALKGIEIVA